MKKKIIYSLIILLLISSCGKTKNNNNEIINSGKIINQQNLVKDNNIQKNDNIINNTGSIQKNNLNTGSGDLFVDEKKYNDFYSLSNEKILTYNCENFKTSIYQEKCLKYKNIVNYVKLDEKNSQLKNNKMKILEKGDLSYCNSYLSNDNREYDDEYGYFNCSLGFLLLNDKLNCSDIKNVKNFNKYFGKSCEDVIKNLNNYINIKIAEFQYNQIISSFWGEQDKVDFNENINEIYFNKILNEKNKLIGGGEVNQIVPPKR